ncbi:MAG: MBL fold metallo-hydrolase [Treponema sp.]|jgi:L-ascorbate metabolism protein UlaG (beta-lactamase superfamily)|nr:MBL fold metallo-hydrolase [Treponema sp.]
MKKNKKLSLWLWPALMLFSCCASKPPEFSEAGWLEKVNSADTSLLYANHIDDKGIYFNPWLQRDRTQRSGSWFFHKKPQYEEFSSEQYGSVKNDYSYLKDENFDSISFAGHASLIIKMNGRTIFTDPFFSGAALIVQKKVKIKFDFSEVPEKPVVLISHNHYDHLDKYSVKKLAEKDAVFIVPPGLKKLITGYGVKTVHELDWWRSITLDGIEYTLLPAQHWSRRIGQKGGSVLWGGYLIRSAKTVYFSGDTGYFPGFREFGKRWDIDYALLGAGAYEPRWFMHYSHMNVNEFFLAARELKAKLSIPVHFGIISLSDEPVLYPLYEIDQAIKQNPQSAEKIKPLRAGEYIQIK